MPPGASSRRRYLRSSPTLVRSQHFKAARNVSFGDTNLSTVRGNQYNSYTIQEKKKATHFIVGTEEEEAEYDQFLEIKRGDFVALEDIHRSLGLVFDEEREGRITLGERAVVVGDVRIGGMASKCTVVSYSGDGAEQLWKTDFQRFGGARYIAGSRSAEKAQMVGINRSKVPMIILTGGLVPAAHLMERAGVMGRMYLKALARQMGCWGDDSLWMDASRGVFCRGPQGPRCGGRSYLPLENLPSDTELLREEVVIRYSASRKEDHEVLEGLSMPQHASASRIRVSRPTIISTLTDTTLAVVSGVWWKDGDSCLGEKEVLANGTTRFTLKDDQRRLKFKLESIFDPYAWLAQAPSTFHAHGIPLEGDLSAYKLIFPEKLTATLSNSRVKRQRRQNHPSIYLFLSSSIFWSFNPTGQTSIPNNLCRHLGLPLRLLPECTEFSWPTERYKTLQAYQIARGFDPTTTDFVRHNRLPIFEAVEQPLPSRFEEINYPVAIFAPENVTSDASTAHTSRFNCPIRTGPPSIPSQKGQRVSI
ncbi:hypothetical protein V5O48_012094 [Marasmius crinis-equi]|uniref:Uncharacterized protein n=1 Tax=Marasmius crinis-equi TaxID=585013 RepID=A0ABR3F3W5_9AGAR